LASVDQPVDVATWLSRLVQIPSVNVAHAGPRAGITGEVALGVAVANWMTDLGADWVESESGPDTGERSNIYAFFGGRTDRVVALDVHMDTVGVEQMTDDPFSGRIADGRVWGRGSIDAKAMLAAAIGVLQQFQADGTRPECGFLLVNTISEESGGFRGAELFAQWARRTGMHINELLIAEPTALSPVFGHKGGVGVGITVTGRTAHSSRPELGANAIDGAADIVAAVRSEHERLQRDTHSAVLGPGSVSTVEIRGGAARNIIPDCCTVYFTRRLTDGETMQQAANEIIALARQATPLSIEAEIGNGGDPFMTSANGPLVQRFAALSGRAPAVSTLGTNAFRYEGLADQTVVFGPGSVEQAHAPSEWCEISELNEAAAVLARHLTMPVDVDLSSRVSTK
jgi:acetylornithine deacetylase/succinyl-diaminopimelate desuccinylase-like protein